MIVIETVNDDVQGVIHKGQTKATNQHNPLTLKRAFIFIFHLTDSVFPRELYSRASYLAGSHHYTKVSFSFQFVEHQRNDDE